MAHEISEINVNGQMVAEAMYAMRPAWHGLGTVLPSVPDSAQAIAAAHLDWRVALRPLATPEGRQVADHFATVRQDTGDILGVVGNRYQIVQNHDAFEFLDSLLQDGIMRYESAGALRGGRIVWLLARLPSVDEIAPGDSSLRYVLFSTSHDGSAAIHAVPTSVRVVCANTLRVAVANDIGFRHTGNVTAKMEFARQYLSQFDERFTLFRDKARLLAERQYTSEQATEYIHTLFPPVAEFGRSRSIRERKVDAVRVNFRNSRQSIPSIKGTWWSLVKAVTESIDHAPRGRSASRNRDDLASRESRMLSLTDGTGADFKARAFNLAVELAG
jgi:phage/plasmid-like protein (TIGR03299 family)